MNIFNLTPLNVSLMITSIVLSSIIIIRSDKISHIEELENQNKQYISEIHSLNNDLNKCFNSRLDKINEDIEVIQQTHSRW